MFYEGHDIYSRSFQVNPGFTASIARFVKQDGLGGVCNLTAATDLVSGVAMEEHRPVGTNYAIPNAYPTRDGVRVRIIGTAPVETAEAINFGDPIAATADGRAKKATGTDQVIGEAYTKTTDAGQLVWVFLRLL